MNAMRLIACTFALLLMVCDASQAKERLALDKYTCAEFLHDTTKLGNSSKVLKTMMMISWATGYASGQEQKFARADASAFVFMAGMLGAACRKSPAERVTQVIARLLQQPSPDKEGNRTGAAASASSRSEASAAGMSPARTGIKQQAKEFVRSIEARWSKPNSLAFVGLGALYKDEVMYYGRIENKDTIVQEKRWFGTRWPARKFTLEGPILASCHNHVCTVRGRVDYKVLNPAARLLSEGVARYDYELEDSKGGMKIQKENAKVVRQKQVRIR